MQSGRFISIVVGDNLPPFCPSPVLRGGSDTEHPPGIPPPGPGRMNILKSQEPRRVLVLPL